jgi:hypothetical protein
MVGSNGPRPPRLCSWTIRKRFCSPDSSAKIRAFGSSPPQPFLTDPAQLRLYRPFCRLRSLPPERPSEPVSGDVRPAEASIVPVVKILTPAEAFWGCAVEQWC